MINQLLKQVLLQNELGGNKSLAYKLSLAHGGTSGPSFGLSQFDIANNRAGMSLLKEICKDIPSVLEKYLASGFAFGWSRIDKSVVDQISNQIKIKWELVDLADDKQISDLLLYCYNACGLVGGSDLSDIDQEVIIGLADTVNQFGNGVSGINKNSGTVVMCKEFLARKDRMAGEFLEALRKRKLAWKWGKTNPNDVNRRINNILDAMNIDLNDIDLGGKNPHSVDEPITRESASWILG